MFISLYEEFVLTIDESVNVIKHKLFNFLKLFCTSVKTDV